MDLLSTVQLANPTQPKNRFVSQPWLIAYGLLNFCFLVRDMLTDHWIKLTHLQFFWGGAFILSRRIKMPSPRSRNQLDFIAHSSRSS